ncbi:MAG: hypothetical protein ACE14M_01665 [Terriglobales bacterium]
MSLRGRARNSTLIIGLVVLITGSVTRPLQAKPRTSDKGQTVDSGSYGVFLAGKRIATETFRIEQGPDVSTATSEFKLEQGGNFNQKSELQITSTGDLRRYEWQELSPEKAQAVVEPNNEFLIEHLVPSPPGKPVDQPFILPTSTMVLDDYFFTHRQILIWRYLAQACKGALKDCRPERLQFGVLVPRQRVSLPVTLEYTGVDKVAIRGVERELNRFSLKSDAGEWELWTDPELKLVRILMAADKLEVVRD